MIGTFERSDAYRNRISSEEMRQRETCSKCEWKALEHHGDWCYMFRQFMKDCKQFKQNSENKE